MADLSARPDVPASSTRVAELHQLAREDYAKGQQERAAVPNLFPSYAAGVHVPEPSDLDVAIRVAQQLLDSGQLLSVREALRLLLRALDAEPLDASGDAEATRCPAAHPDDPTSCVGPAVVTVLDAHNSGADGCEHHAARLLASIDRARVYALPDVPDGAAIRVFKAADGIRPFPWVDAPRTRDEQLSRAETRARGEGQ